MASVSDQFFGPVGDLMFIEPEFTLKLKAREERNVFSIGVPWRSSGAKHVSPRHSPETLGPSAAGTICRQNLSNMTTSRARRYRQEYRCRTGM
jgi:hypothetical protein